MQTSEKGIDLIKKHEGLMLKPYRDVAGVWTIGYGHTRTASVDMGEITEQQAEDLLRSDLAIAEAVVNTLARMKQLNQNQFDALVSFTFNVGGGAFKRSTLARYIAEGKPDADIREQFGRWKFAGGKVWQGLINRRKDEADLYFEKL